jgi:hypothetical protein
LEEDNRNEKEAIKQIDDARRIVSNAGGEPFPRDGNNINQLGEEMGSQHEGFPSDNRLADPFESYSELQPLNFSMADNMSTGYHRSYQNQHLSTSAQKNAFELMQAVYCGDLETIQNAALLSRVCVVDSVGLTPLFLAVLMGNVSSLRVIFEIAKHQLQAHAEKLKSLQRERHDPSDDNETNNLINNQLRRLNNLDLAAGEMPKDAGPTPDMMRQALEAAESAALNQSEANTASGKQVASSVSPESLLLHRSIVIPDEDEEPRLAELKHRLATKQPYSFHEAFLKQPLRLRPIELAIIRGDAKMVEALIELALNVAGDDTAEEGHETEAGATEGDSFGDDEEDHDEGEMDDDFYDDGDDGATAATNITNRLITGVGNIHKLRYLLAGDGSRNPDLGYMTLTQLAIAVNDVPILCSVASYAREHMLPRGAVAAWKREVDANDDAEVDEETKHQRQIATELISGKSSYYHKIPLWTSKNNSCQQNSNQILVHTTPLQFALSVGSDRVSKVLMSTEADDSLLGWIQELREDDLHFDVSQRKNCRAWGFEGASSAALWILRHVSDQDCGLSELAFRLLRPTAPDAAGRTALFYSPADFVSAVVNSAAIATIKVMSDESESSARTAFLESLSSVGSVTALLAAASSGELDRVKALIDAGCNRSKPAGPKQWGPIHLAIPNKTISNMRTDKYSHLDDPQEPSESESDPWATARNIIESILDGASESEIHEALLSPQAEHTPLMLAAERGADAETILFLVEKMAARAAEGLAARAGELNSTLHLAVGAALGDSDEGASKALGGVAALFDLPDAPDVLGANVENARGVTPFELALHSVTSVWSRSTAVKQGYGGGQHHNALEQRRNQIGRGPLPPKRPSEQKEGSAMAETLIGRKALSLLEQGASESGNRRLSVGFDEVKEAQQRAAERAKNAIAAVIRKYHGMQTGEDQQSEPTGPPAVFVLDRNRARTSTMMGNPPVQWNGFQ